MKFNLNGDMVESDATTLETLLIQEGFDGLFAVAINGTFVPKEQYSNVQLSVDDQIEVVAPMQGG